MELFICQTSGSKRWRLYAPLGGFRLPGESSADLDAAELGEPVAEITLEARTTVSGALVPAACRGAVAQRELRCLCRAASSSTDADAAGKVSPACCCAAAAVSASVLADHSGVNRWATDLEWRLHPSPSDAGVRRRLGATCGTAHQLVTERRCSYAMQVGDVLYLPRGTVHQARAQTRASSHVTLSTYQRWTYGGPPHDSSIRPVAAGSNGTYSVPVNGRYHRGLALQPVDLFDVSVLTPHAHSGPCSAAPCVRCATRRHAGVIVVQATWRRT